MNSAKSTVKLFCSLVAVVALASPGHSQSGRRPKDVKIPPPAEQKEKEESPKPTTPAEPPPVTAEKNEEYRCTDDGSLARILDPNDNPELVVSAKDTDTPAAITAKPKPSYTREARRNSVQGFVTLRVLLSARGKIARVRVVKGLPAGLTENAIRSACKMEFKPAMKNGRAVSVWLTAEYVFRLADSSIFSP